MQNIDWNKPIKSKTVRYISIALIVLLVIFAFIGIFTDKLDSVGFDAIKFHHEQKKIDTRKIEKKSGDDIQIQNMNGDIIKDSATKNVYNNLDGKARKK